MQKQYAKLALESTLLNIKMIAKLALESTLCNTKKCSILLCVWGVCMCVCNVRTFVHVYCVVCMCIVCSSTCEDQETTFGSQFFPSTM